jgi:RimJ/RimL family protein N-acetyltransferase
MATLSDLKPIVLMGEHIYLEPLEERHAAELFAIGRDELMWRYMSRGPMLSEEDARRFIERALMNRTFGGEFPFAIRLRVTDALIGSTRYQDIQPQHRSVEIGWTFVHPSHWRIGAGTESQYLLVRHAIEDLGAGRVWFKTDARNPWTQKALCRCGVTREGVLRRHMRARDGFIRDSVIFSIIEEEWPTVKQRVEKVLGRIR